MLYRNVIGQLVTVTDGWTMALILVDRVLSRIFFGGKMLKVLVDGGCRHRLQFSRGVWGHAPPRNFLNFEPSESGSEAF